MTTKQIAEFRVYVGTYAKYNGGSLEGKWLPQGGFNVGLGDHAVRDALMVLKHQFGVYSITAVGVGRIRKLAVTKKGGLRS